MYPAAGQPQMAEMLPRAQVVRFDGCGPTIPFEAPGRFVKHPSRFLFSRGAATAGRERPSGTYP